MKPSVIKQDDGSYKTILLHRYIISELDNQEIPKKYVVHHINSKRYDNTLSNLMVTTSALNNACIKRDKKSSDTFYKGLHFSKDTNKWVAQISYNKRTYHLGFFDNDKDAAFKHDICHYAIYRTIIGSNELLDEETIKKIDENPSEYLPKAKYDERELPKFVVQLPYGAFRVRIRPHKIDKAFKELEDAKKYISDFFEKLEKQKQEKILSEEILRNENNIAIIKVENRKLKTIEYSLVSEEDYYKLIPITWYVNKDGYADSSIELMHRYIMNCESNDGNIIDHINKNKLDNRRDNLRFTTYGFNNRNKLKRSDCSSKYVGVYWRKDKEQWEAYITIKGKRIQIGYYDDEEDARDAYLDYYRKLEEQETAKSAEELANKLANINI